MKTDRAVRATLAGTCGALSAIVVYGALRVVQSLLLPEPDPALVVWSEHSGYYWRVWTAAYAGGMGVFVGWLAATRAPSATARRLAAGVVVATVLLVLQALIAP